MISLDETVYWFANNRRTIQCIRRGFVSGFTFDEDGDLLYVVMERKTCKRFRLGRERLFRQNPAVTLVTESFREEGLIVSGYFLA